MGADLNQIKHNLEALAQQTTQILLNSQAAYQGYLNVLGRLVSQQLVMAAYHICTQAEPAAFLALSLSQQQLLQQGLQKQGHQLQQALQIIMQTLLDPNEPIRTEPQKLLQALYEMEEEIVNMLRETSRQANQLLQDHNILTIKSMDTLFEIAAKAEESGRSITSAPHLLKALVEGKDSNSEDKIPTVAIYLQVADLEFMDSELMGWRHQLRQLMQQLLAINKEYEQQLEEQMRSEAEAAWRASWFAYHPDDLSSSMPGSEISGSEISGSEISGSEISGSE